MKFKTAKLNKEFSPSAVQLFKRISEADPSVGFQFGFGYEKWIKELEGAGLIVRESLGPGWSLNGFVTKLGDNYIK